MFTLVPFKWNSFVLHRLHIVIPNWCSFIIDCDGPFLSAFSHNSIPMSNCSVRYRRGPKKCINRSPIKSFLRFFPGKCRRKIQFRTDQQRFTIEWSHLFVSFEMNTGKNEWNVCEITAFCIECEFNWTKVDRSFTRN